MTASPPVAKRIPQVLETHGDVRIDEWGWLRNRHDPDTIAYLEAENAHTEAATAHLEALRERIFQEIKGRVQETDLSVPVPHGDWEYYTRTEEGLEYAIHCRRPRGSGDGGPEQVLVDENALAEGHEYFDLRALAVSPDHRVLAYAVNTDGSDDADIRFRDLETGHDLPDVVERVTSQLAWASDNRTLFYVHRDAALRPHQLWRHSLGTPPGDDELVMQEDDERFRLSVTRARSGAVLVVHLVSKTTTEAWLLDATAPSAEPRLVHPRETGVEYRVSHQGERLLIVTNWEAPDNRLMAAPVGAPGRDHWTEVVPPEPAVKLVSVDAFAGFVALYERAGGVQRIRILDAATGDVHIVDQDEAVSTATAGVNREYETATLRYGYTSLVTPSSVYDYDVPSRQRTLRKRTPVLGGYDPDDYETTRIWATASDGAQIPMSLLYRKGTNLDGSNPCLLYGYGSYEISIDPSFAPTRLSLVDRGVVFAIAHIRGGGELGRAWYEQGKFLAKRTTFTDFIACAEHLVGQGWTAPERMVAQGGSAGGLLMGAVVNARPDLFRAVVAQVPFVDVVTTMLDETIPLTVPEFEEWGNPKDPEFYAYMKSYSPYDNVEAKDYPPMLVTTGLNDTRVAFWEPAKWVAKLRATKTDSNQLLLKTELGAGHAGPSGRYGAWREVAFVYAWVLDQLGLGEA